MVLVKKISLSAFIAIVFFLAPAKTSFAQDGGTYVTVTVIQGERQTEIVVHYGGDKFDDIIVSPDEKEKQTKDVTVERQFEYNKVLDILNDLGEKGYEVEDFSVSMAGKHNHHPYSVYVLKKEED